MIRTITGIAVTILLLGAAQAQAASQCNLKRYATAELVFNPATGMLLPVRVGGQDAWMVLTMSNGMAMISPAAVAQFGLKTTPARADINLRANGVPIEREATIPSLAIGGANFTGWKLYVQPGQARPLPTYMGRPVIGNFSSSFMNAVDLELDFATGRIHLYEHSRCKGGQVYWGGDYMREYIYVDPSGLLYFPIELDGKRVEASLNTQGPRTRFSEQIARRFFGFRRDPSVADARPAGQNVVGGFVGSPRMSLTAREISLDNVTVQVYDDMQRRCEFSQSERGSNALGFRNCFGFVPLEIGTDVLRQLRIYIASEEKRIYITRNAGSAPAAPGGGANAGAGAGLAPGAGAGLAPGAGDGAAAAAPGAPPAAAAADADPAAPPAR